MRSSARLPVATRLTTKADHNAVRHEPIPADTTEVGLPCPTVSTDLQAEDTRASLCGPKAVRQACHPATHATGVPPWLAARRGVVSSLGRQKVLTHLLTTGLD
jgi:hypothetical protein